ncbi:hypothetical protein MAHJHV55_51640 [Mycobacterium avium subsp. hominissuis]
MSSRYISRALTRWVIPRRLVTSCEHFHRQAVGIVPPNGVRSYKKQMKAAAKAAK